MKCDRHDQLHLTDVGGLRRVARWIHLLFCPSCRAEAAEVRALANVIHEIPRFDPPDHLLAAVLSLPHGAGPLPAARKERLGMRRLAYGLTFVLLVSVAIGLALSPEGRSGGSVLISAAAAMAESGTLHVRGESNLADQYDPWFADPGSYERWYSPEGFRFDYYDAEGHLKRSIGGDTQSGQAWQFYPGWMGFHMARMAQAGDAASCGVGGGSEAPDSTPAGALFTYDVGPERLRAFVALSRNRFSQGNLRLDEIAARGHDWREFQEEWRGETVTVIEESLGVDLVTGDPRGSVEYYLDPDTGRFLGLRQFGPDADGNPLEASVDFLEYDVDVPGEVFEFAAPVGAEVLPGEYYVRPSGDILFRPGPDSRLASVASTAYENLHYAGMGALPWEEAEASYLTVLEEDPDNYMAREYLGRMYTRWGMYEDALMLLPEVDCGWSALNRAFCYDALGQRDQAVELYEKLKDYGHDSIAQWARLGLERPTWPKDLDVSPEPGEFVLKPRPSWTASAFNSSYPFTPQTAIDGDRSRRWGSGGDPSNDGQAPGNWFQLDFGEPTRVSRILLDHYGVYAIVNDWPRGIRGEYTVDGTTWQEISISQAGPMRPATVRFDPAQTIRATRFETTEYHMPEWWSIHEIYVYAPYD